MSASRERKTRVADPAQGLTQKQIKEQKEAAAKKRNRIVYSVVGVVLAAAVAALLVWDSGLIQKMTTAATMGDRKYSVVDMDYYYYQAVNSQYNMYQAYAAYGLTPPFDISKPLSQQYVDEAKTQTYQQQFQDSALETMQNISAFCTEAEKAGYTLSEEGEQELADVLAQIDQVCAQNGITRSVYLKQSYGKHMTEKIWLNHLKDSIFAEDFQRNHEEGLTYSEEQLETYYSENAATMDSYDYRYFFIDGAAPNPMDEEGNPQKDADGNVIEATDEEKAAALAEAKEKAGQAVSEITDADSSETAFADAAAKYVAEEAQEDYKADPDASLIENEVGSALSGTPYESWMTDAARTTGDVSAIVSEGSNAGYYVIMYLDRARDESNTADIRHILIKAELGADDPDTADVDESQTPTQEALDAAKAEAQALLDQYNAGDKTAEAFGALAEEHSADTGSAANGGLIERVYQGQTFPDFNDWVLDAARTTGDVDMIENPQAGQQGWHVVYFQDWAAPVWKTTAENTLRSEAQTAWVTALLEPYTAEKTNAMGQVGR